MPVLGTYLQNIINIKPRFYRIGGTWTSHVSRSTAFGADANRQREGRMPACTSTSGRYLKIQEGTRADTDRSVEIQRSHWGLFKIP